jgi:hypothetical protein
MTKCIHKLKGGIYTLVAKEAKYKDLKLGWIPCSIYKNAEGEFYVRQVDNFTEAMEIIEKDCKCSKNNCST